MGPTAVTGKWSRSVFVPALMLGLIAAKCALSEGAGDKVGPDRAPNLDSEVRALVRQLGSSLFAEREAATQSLRELGVKALPTVIAGQKHADREVARRCEALVQVIRADWLRKFLAELRADTAGQKEHDHPIWQRYKKIAGVDRVARSLLVEMLHDRRAQLLDAAESDPEQAGELYRQEVERLAEKTQNAVTMPIPPRGQLALDWFDPMPQPAEIAVGFYLGTFPSSARVFAPPGEQREVHGLRPVPESMGLFHNAFQDGVKGQFGPPLKRLFAAWLAQRADPESILNGLDKSRTGMIAEALPAARQIATNAKLPVKSRAATLPVLGMYGGPADERLVSAFLADTSIFTEYQHAGRKTTVHVRDLALGTLVAMRGRNPGEFGFPSFANQDFGPNRYVYFYPHALGFFDSASREAAHRRAKEWLASNARP